MQSSVCLSAKAYSLLVSMVFEYSAIIFLSFLLRYTLFITAITDFASLSAYLCFTLIATVWLAFCVRYNHLLSLGMFYRNAAKYWGFFEILKVIVFTKYIWKENRRNTEVKATGNN